MELKLTKYFLSVVFLLTVSFPMNAVSAVISKVKSKQALIELNGLQTKKGAYFVALNIDGERKGLLKIKRVSNTKAIGVLKYGSMSERWYVQPISQKRALAIQKKALKRAQHIARLQREKQQRRLAYQKYLAKQEKIKRKRAVLKRKLASYEGGEYLMEDSPDNSNYQSKEILSHNTMTQAEPGLQTKPLPMMEQPLSSSFRRFALGLSSQLNYNFMKLNPNRPGQSSYLISNLGYGAFITADFHLNRFLRLGGNFGYNKVSLFAEEKNCGGSGGCDLLVHYLVGALNLKLNLMELGDHRLWLAGEGILMQPLAYSNSLLSDESFSPVHGAVGGRMGFDFVLGKFMLPMSVGVNINMPPTETVLKAALSTELGLSYRF